MQFCEYVLSASYGFRPWLNLKSEQIGCNTVAENLRRGRAKHDSHCGGSSRVQPDRLLSG